MLKLFANIFGATADAGTTLPADLVEAAIERVVDGTEPRLRIVSGYGRALRKPVIHAAHHIIALIDSLPPPVLLDRASLAAQPEFAALCYSLERMEQLLARDAAMAEFRAANAGAPGPVTAALVAHRTEKRGLGYGELEGRTVQDVPRTIAGFEQHALVAIAASETESRRLMKRRALDHLLSLALSQITQCKDERKLLSERSALLRSKLKIMQRGGSLTQFTGAEERVALQARLEDLEQQLAQLGAPEDVLSGNLAIVVDVLSNASKHLWLENKALFLDRFYVVHDKPAASAPKVVFNELRNSEGGQVTVQMIMIEL